MKSSRMRSFVCLVLFLMGPTCVAEGKDRPFPGRAFSLVVRGEAGSFAVGDLNTTLRSIDAYPWWLRESAPDRIIGHILAVSPHFVIWETEFRWNAWKGLSVGIALAGPTRLSGESSLSYAYSTSRSDYLQSEVRVAVPVKFSLYYSLPAFSRLSMVAGGGIGLYRARMIQTHEWLYTDASGVLTTGTYRFDVTGNKTGFHCGVGLEYWLSRRFSMAVEGEWRFADIKSLTGTSTLITRSYNEYLPVKSSDSGFLYHYLLTDFAGFHQEKLGVYADPSTIANDVSGLRKAFLDLSGFSIKIALRIGLF